MAKRSLSEQLDDAVESMMADRDARLPRTTSSLTALLRIAADLRDLPRADFKAGLQAELRETGPRPIRVKPVPEGLHTATPCLIARDTAAAIEFYKKAFGATEIIRHTDPSGHIMHAEIAIGDSRLALAEEAVEWGNRSPQSLGGSSVIISLYVEDVDALASQAVAAGAKVIFPVQDQFYGDRAGRLADPFGHIWIVATHQEDVLPEELERRVATWAEQAGGTPPSDAPSPVQPIRTGFRSITPYLQVDGAAHLIEFVKGAFGAQELNRVTRPDGIAHAEVKIGDSILEMADATAEFKPMPTAIHLYVEDADAVYQRAVRAGATSMHEPIDQPYGDREAGVKDPFGNHWYIATYQGERPSAAVRHMPEGLHSITPYLHPHGAPNVIEFLKQAFDAQEAFVHQAPDGTVVHAKIRIGDSVVEMGEAHGPYQPMPAAIHLYVGDADEAYRRALRAGATTLFEPSDADYGDRVGGVTDPFGNVWYIATHKKDVSGPTQS